MPIKMTKAIEGRRIRLVSDDIRISPMVDFWNNLPLSKFDITFIGHQSGTGIALLKADR